MKTIIEMAREAGDDWEHTLKEDRKFLERFAALVAAAEREACAKVCDANKLINAATNFEIATANKCAAAIRARGNTCQE
jgi:hypothetical protein